MATTVYFPAVYSNKLIFEEKRIGMDVPFPTVERAQEVAEVGINIATIGSLVYVPTLPFARYDAAYQALLDVDIELVPILHGTPYHMRDENGLGIVLPAYWDEYASFAAEAAGRYEAVNYIQLWNEPDILPEYSVANYYGGWGAHPELFASFVNLCGAKIKRARPDVSLAIALSGDLFWLRQFVKAGGMEYIDYVFLHYYVWWGDNQYAAIWELRERIDTVGDITDTSVWVTETNLLSEESYPDYENEKRNWVLALEGILDKTNVLMVYSWEANWKNANIKDLPAEEAMKYLATKYNTTKLP